jgi:hypothetical protein
VASTRPCWSTSHGPPEPPKIINLQSPDAVSQTVVMDTGLHFLDLVNQVRALASGTVEFVTLPVTGVGARNDRGQSIVTVDIPVVRAYVAGLITSSPPAASAATVRAAGWGARWLRGSTPADPQRRREPRRTLRLADVCPWRWVAHA